MQPLEQATTPMPYLHGL